MLSTKRAAKQVALLLLGFLCVGGWSEAANDVTTLSLVDAKILVYVSPVGERSRKDGLDIAVEVQSSAHLNQADYYYFWVYNAKREQASGSVTIGYFAVNKHTAELWDTGAKKEISNKLVLGVQKMLREFHNVDGGTIARYRSRPF